MMSLNAHVFLFLVDYMYAIHFVQTRHVCNEMSKL